jgi:hypothetical protein
MKNIRNRQGFLRNRDGAIIPIVAVCLVMLLGCAAIAIDIGMLLDSRAEAQRAADAAALAGASALLEFRSSSEAVRRDAATQRAENVAGMNVVRDGAVTPAEVGIEFLDSDRRIAATVTRGSIPPLLATIFGVNSLQVSATAHAMYYQGNSASCLKPFGVPDRDPFTLSSIGQQIVIWQKSTHNDYPLVKHLIKDAGGNNVRAAIQSEICDNTLVTVGEWLELQSGTAPMTGQVEQGLETLFSRDSDISYNPSSPGTHPYEGFNRPDWRASSRIMNLVTYEPSTATQTTFKASGFLTIFMNQPMQNAPQGDRIQYGIVLPHKAVGGTGVCTPPNCAALSFALRLVQ